MRGTILGVHDGRGVLLGTDDRRLEFPLSEWRSAGTPTPGQIVDFVETEGEARGVFAVPGGGGTVPPLAPQSTTMTMSIIAVACLALGFIIPLVLPTICAFVLGVIAAGRAKVEREETALVLARIAWIGAAVMFGFVILVLSVIALFFGGLASFGWWHHWY
ncbi:MAG TPA: hypothetical protein VG943_13505 [Caulobacterales bacterium]|nr:hypothetical protein [Caulobacterales bacterium]